MVVLATRLSPMLPLTCHQCTLADLALCLLVLAVSVSLVCRCLAIAMHDMLVLCQKLLGELVGLESHFSIILLGSFRVV